MRDSPLFSVVIPTWNRADSMLVTLDSCWRQSCRDFEVILVDDGSTDNTAEVAQRITDPRFRYVHQNNAGPARARNHGMDLARGRYVAFLDSDDVWLPEHLANAQSTLADSSADFLYSQIIVDRGVDKYWIKPARALRNNENIFDYLYVDGGFIQTSTIIISSARAVEVRWDEQLTYGDNDQFAIDLWKHGAIPVMLPKSQTLYADILSPDALSQLPIFNGNTSRHTNFLDWMATQGELMSEPARRAFAARFESVALARNSPLRALSLIWQAWRGNAMSAKAAARQILLSFTPRQYRRLTDLYVHWRGADLASQLKVTQTVKSLDGDSPERAGLKP